MWKLMIYLKVMRTLFIVDRILKKKGFRELYAMIIKLNTTNKLKKAYELTDKEFDYLENVIHITEKLCFYFLGNAKCLHRSVVGYLILKKKQFPVDLVIGVRKKPFMSHAWLELYGQVINDTPETISDMIIQIHTGKNAVRRT